jgi:hypothetical protein
MSDEPARNAQDSGVERFRKLNRRFAIAATVVIAAIAMMMVIYAIVALRGLQAPVLLRLALSWSPSLFYLWALWTLRDLFVQLAHSGPGVQFGVTAALAKIGWALMLGSLATLVVTPLINMMTEPHHLGSFPLFDVPALTLGMVGLALLVVAPMLKRALHFEAEAKSLKNVLEGFV